jgi:hypothetical protein
LGAIANQQRFLILLDYLFKQTRLWAFGFPQERSLERALTLAFGILCGVGKRTLTRAITSAQRSFTCWRPVRILAALASTGRRTSSFQFVPQLIASAPPVYFKLPPGGRVSSFNSATRVPHAPRWQSSNRHGASADTEPYRTNSSPMTTVFMSLFFRKNSGVATGISSCPASMFVVNALAPTRASRGSGLGET